MALSRGFLVANNNLNIRGDDANDVVSAEALMMLKEHVVESYGPIRYTIGAGCSGGSIQQHQIAANYPGLLDGIQPNCSFQDSWTTANEVGDCHLLRHYFAGDPSFTTAQQSAVMDVRDPRCLHGVGSVASRRSASRLASRTATCRGRRSRRWSTTPRRTRRAFAATCRTTSRRSGASARRTASPARRYANVGIQYGLNALNAGTITPAQFVALNAGVGGTDIDLNFTAARSPAGQGRAEDRVPHRPGHERRSNSRTSRSSTCAAREHLFNDIHTDYHSYVLRARLDAANHTHANQLIWTWDGALVPTNIGPPPSIALKSFLLMDKWLSNIEADTSHKPLREKVLDDKPSGATDECLIGAALTETTDPAACAAAFPYFGDARLAAGESMVDNAMQCRLQKLDRHDYAVTFTDAQWAALEQAFPDGVCNWKKKPVGWKNHSTPWLTYAAGPGGKKLGHAPESHPGPPH